MTYLNINELAWGMSHPNTGPASPMSQSGEMPIKVHTCIQPWSLIGYQTQYLADHWLLSPVRSGHKWSPRWNVVKPVTLPPLQASQSFSLVWCQLYWPWIGWNIVSDQLHLAYAFHRNQRLTDFSFLFRQIKVLPRMKDNLSLVSQDISSSIFFYQHISNSKIIH